MKRWFETVSSSQINHVREDAMTDVLNAISREAQWLKVSREELLDQLREANRVASRRWRRHRPEWRSLITDIGNLVDRSIEPVFDAALAVTSFAHDVSHACRRILGRN